MNNNFPLILTANNENTPEYYIVFKEFEKQYAINIQNVIEVINIPEIEFLEQTPKGIIGLMNYNGTIVKVIDLYPFLGYEHTSFSVNDKLIVVYVGDDCFAVHTDKIINIEKFKSNDIQNVPFEMENSIIRNIYRMDMNNIGIIDVETVKNLVTAANLPAGEIKYSLIFPSDEKSKEILNLRTIKSAGGQNKFSFPVDINSMKQYILFTLDNHNYYLDLKYIKEFVSIKRLNITKLPYTRDFIKGMINIKGNFLIVIDLKRFLNNNPNSLKEGSKLIITQGKDFETAFLVDEIKYIKNLKNIQKDFNENFNSEYILHEFMEDGELYNILNFEKIINDERIYINTQ